MKAALRRRLGRAARVLEASGWDESAHPREPDGSSIGGRFANKGGPGLRMAAPAGQGGASSAEALVYLGGAKRTKRSTVVAAAKMAVSAVTPADTGALRQEVDREWPDRVGEGHHAGASMARQALDDIKDGAQGATIRAGGRLVGVLAYKLKPRAPKRVHVSYLGTPPDAPPGVGIRLMVEAARYGVDVGAKGITLESLSGSVDFYKRLGFRSVAGSEDLEMTLSPAGMDALATALDEYRFRESVADVTDGNPDLRCTPEEFQKLCGRARPVRGSRRGRRLREVLLRVLEASGWDESQHPREPGGSSIGGRFANKSGPGLRMAAPAGQGGAPSVAVRRLSDEDMKATSDDAASSYIMEGASAAYGAEEHDDADDVAARLKDSVAQRLAEAAGIPYETANAIVATWMMSANDSNLDSLELQEAISQEFGVPLSTWQQKRIDGLRALELLDGGALRESVLASVKDIASAASAGDEAGIARGLDALAAAALPVADILVGDDSSPAVKVGRVVRKLFPETAPSTLHRLVGIIVIGAGVRLGQAPPGTLAAMIDKEAGASLADTAGKLGALPPPGDRDNVIPPATLRKAARAMYEMTQADLADQGLRGDLLLFRGSTLAPGARAPKSGRVVRTPTNAASSWTSERTTAQAFGGVVMARRVPVSRILSSPVTGLGCLREFEFVVLGDPSGFEDQTAHFILGERVGEAFSVPMPRAKRRRLLEAARILEHGAGWNEADHPRDPAGTSTGGQFTAKAADGSPLQPGHLVAWSAPGRAPSTYTGPLPEGGVNGSAEQQQQAAAMAERVLAPLRGRGITNINGDRQEYARRAAVAIHQRLRGAVPLPTIVAAVEQWSDAANNHSLRAMSLQEAAAEEFGTSLSPWQQENLKGLEHLRRQAAELRATHAGRIPTAHQKRLEPVADRATERRILRAMYEETQERLRATAAANGLPPYVLAYRGVNLSSTVSRPRNLPRGTVVRTPTNALSSYANTPHAARWFAEKGIGLVTTVRVPFEQVLSTALSGFGDPSEGEFVVIGDPSGHRFEEVESAP